MSCKTCDIQIKKSDALGNCEDPKIGHFSLNCFLKSKGITPNLWEIEDGFLQHTQTGVEGINIGVEDGSGLLRIFDDEGDTAIFLGASAANAVGFSGLAFIPSNASGNIVAMDEFNIFSDLVTFRNSTGQDYFIGDDSIGTIFKNNPLFLENLPEHADEAAAVVAGLAANQVYKTATGELRIKL